MTPEMQRAAVLSQRLFDRGLSRHLHAATGETPTTVESPEDVDALCAEALSVLKELMDEITRWENRAEAARRKADELVAHLNGRWG